MGPCAADPLCSNICLSYFNLQWGRFLFFQGLSASGTYLLFRVSEGFIPWDTIRHHPLCSCLHFSGEPCMHFNVLLFCSWHSDIITYIYYSDSIKHIAIYVEKFDSSQLWQWFIQTTISLIILYTIQPWKDAVQSQFHWMNVMVCTGCGGKNSSFWFMYYSGDPEGVR